MNAVRVSLIVLPVALAAAAFVARGSGRTAYVPRTRTYFVAAEDIEWNYAPFNADPVMGQRLPEPWGARTVYHKAHYVRYADSTFTTAMPTPPSYGILGPMIHAVVGDTVKIVFRNSTSAPVSMHAHGVRYAPADEG